MALINVTVPMIMGPSESMTEDCYLSLVIDDSTNRIIDADYTTNSTRSWVESWGPDGTADFWLEENCKDLMERYEDDDGSEYYEWQEYEM